MKMRLTEEGRRRLYMTRHMWTSENEANIDPQSVEAVHALGYAEYIDKPEAPAAAPKRRGRPPKHMAAAPAKPAAKPEEPTLEEKTVPELRELAEEMGVDLPSGYVRKDELVELVGAADEDDGA